MTDGPSYMYEYESLPSKHHIRRLVLEPGQRDDPLRGSLELVDLYDKATVGSYEAISYVWGDPVMDHWILVDGVQLYITRNLLDALRQTRKLDEPRRLWTDSICINQNDMEEKGHQVSLMARIYETSQRTLICLGFEWGNRGADTARDVAAFVIKVNGMIQNVFRESSLRWKANSFPWPKADGPLVLDTRSDAWNQMILHPWFSRGWVVQEAAFGPEASILWADIEIEWIRVLRVNYWFSKRLLLFKKEVYTLPRLHVEQYLLRKPKEAGTYWPETEKQHLEAATTLDVLNLGRTLQVSEPSDRIYAFMNLPTSDGKILDELQIQPNYNKDQSYVNWDFAVKYLERYWDLGLLSCVEHDDSRMLNSYPSWIPRWDCGRDAHPWYNYELEATEHEHEPTEKPYRFINNNVLAIRGNIVGCVQYVSKAIEQHNSVCSNVQDFVSLWREVRRKSYEYPCLLPYDSRWSLAFIRTLSRGGYHGDWQAWETTVKSFTKTLFDDAEYSEDTEVYTKDGHARFCSEILADLSRHRRFILLGDGKYGVAPKITREGDVCAVIPGTRRPFILRAIAGTGSYYKIVGAAYIDCKEHQDLLKGTKEIRLC